MQVIQTDKSWALFEIWTIFVRAELEVIKFHKENNNNNNKDVIKLNVHVVAELSHNFFLLKNTLFELCFAGGENTTIGGPWADICLNQNIEEKNWRYMFEPEHSNNPQVKTSIWHYQPKTWTKEHGDRRKLR